MSGTRLAARRIGVTIPTSIASVVLMVLALLLIHIPETDAARGGGARGGGGGGGARGGGGRGSVRHSSARRSTSAQPSRARTSSRQGATQGRSTTPARASGPSRSAAGGPGRTQVGGAARGRAPSRGASRRGNRRYSARKDARRDWRRWRRNRALFAVGVAVLTRPRYATTVVVTGNSYYYWGGVYYVSSGTRYVVVAPPPTVVVYAVPAYTTVVYAGTTPYYYAGNAYYVATDAPAPQPEIPDDVVLQESEENPPMTQDDHNYEVVEPPVGVTVPYLPDEAEEKRIDGIAYLIYEGTYYRPFFGDGETIYQVVEDPTAST